MGERKQKTVRRRGANLKIKLFRERQVSVSDPATGKTEKMEILRVEQNPANIDYDRRGVITKGTIIETELGLARITSRSGQHGLINATLVPKEAKR